MYEICPWQTIHWTSTLFWTHVPFSCEAEDIIIQLWDKWGADVLRPHSGFIPGVKVMKCLGGEEPCHHSGSVHLWWGWGVNPLASQIYGGKKQVRFPGYLTVDGFPFPAVSSYGLIAVHSSYTFELQRLIEQSYHQKHKLNVTCTKWLCSCSWVFCEVILVTVDKEEHRYLQSLQMCRTENHGGPCTAHFRPWLQKPVESRIRNYLACQHTHIQWRKILMLRPALR